MRTEETDAAEPRPNSQLSGSLDAAPLRASRALNSQPSSGIEEESAYQHAVCTAALGDKSGAEAEYIAFMKCYPSSPLIHAAQKRIARMHGGDLPKDAEATWQAAQKTALTREREAQRQRSMCGPECVAELLRTRSDAKRVRGGEGKKVGDLAKEMGTDWQGTSVAAMVSVLKKHGLPATGLALTTKGLERQKLPVITLLSPGHYVIVESITKSGITVWDPAGGPPTPNLGGDRSGKPARRTYRPEEWKPTWTGIAIAMK